MIWLMSSLAVALRWNEIDFYEMYAADINAALSVGWKDEILK
jgi:hypothetical protein